jgi:hypothetical protein
MYSFVLTVNFISLSTSEMMHAGEILLSNDMEEGLLLASCVESIPHVPRMGPSRGTTILEYHSFAELRCTTHHPV